MWGSQGGCLGPPAFCVCVSVSPDPEPPSPPGDLRVSILGTFLPNTTLRQRGWIWESLTVVLGLKPGRQGAGGGRDKSV